MRTRRHHSEGALVAKSKIVPLTPCGKAGYTNRKIAAQAAAKVRRETGEPVEPYHCDEGCHCLHIGHPPGWAFEQHKRQARAS
jgi:hypothetical protein